MSHQVSTNNLFFWATGRLSQEQIDRLGYVIHQHHQWQNVAFAAITTGDLQAHLMEIGYTPRESLDPLCLWEITDYPVNFSKVILEGKNFPFENYYPEKYDCEKEEKDAIC